jgi:hypothetical protein
LNDELDKLKTMHDHVLGEKAAMDGLIADLREREQTWMENEAKVLKLQAELSMARLDGDAFAELLSRA